MVSLEPQTLCHFIVEDSLLILVATASHSSPYQCQLQQWYADITTTRRQRELEMRSLHYEGWKLGKNYYRLCVGSHVLFELEQGRPMMLA